MPNDEIMKYFEYKHLPKNLMAVSMPFCVLANDVNNMLPNCDEKSTCLRKLLEAKDCAVRAAL